MVLKPGEFYTDVQRDRLKAQAFELSAKGWSFRNIAAEIDVSAATASKLVKEAQEEYKKRYPDPKPQALKDIDLAIEELWKRIDLLPASSRESAAHFRALHDFQEQKNKITGVEAPIKSNIKSDVQHTYTEKLGELSQEQLDKWDKLLDEITEG